MDKRKPSAEIDNMEHTRTGLSVEAIKRAFLDNLFYVQGRFPGIASPNDNYQALAYTCATASCGAG
jgi:glycogen phosphorylase